jgi:hypothetical protein
MLLHFVRCAYTFSSLHASTRHANSLPSGTEWDFYKSYPGAFYNETATTLIFQTFSIATYLYLSSVLIHMPAFSNGIQKQGLRVLGIIERIRCEESHATRHTSYSTRHTSHITRQTSHIARHTSHITRHTSLVTRHKSHVTLHTSS